MSPNPASAFAEITVLSPIARALLIKAYTAIRPVAGTAVLAADGITEVTYAPSCDVVRAFLAGNDERPLIIIRNADWRHDLAVIHNGPTGPEVYKIVRSLTAVERVAPGTAIYTDAVRWCNESISPRSVS